MDTGSMKNIVVIKDLPSNIVEEAIIFLKENHKLKKPELIDADMSQKKGESVKKQENTKSSKDYIVNEAQMLVADYISRIENKTRKEDMSYKQLKKKYERLKKVSALLVISLVATALLSFII